MCVNITTPSSAGRVRRDYGRVALPERIVVVKGWVGWNFVVDGGDRCGACPFRVCSAKSSSGGNHGWGIVMTDEFGVGLSMSVGGESWGVWRTGDGVV